MYSLTSPLQASPRLNHYDVKSYVRNKQQDVDWVTSEGAVLQLTHEVTPKEKYIFELLQARPVIPLQIFNYFYRNVG